MFLSRRRRRGLPLTGSKLSGKIVSISSGGKSFAVRRAVQRLSSLFLYRKRLAQIIILGDTKGEGNLIVFVSPLACDKKKCFFRSNGLALWIEKNDRLSLAEYCQSPFCTDMQHSGRV
jgi:hypothetical protein